MNVKSKLVEAAGVKYLVYSADGYVAKDIAVHDSGAQGIIRVVSTVKMGEIGRLCLAEEPTAKWFLDQYDQNGDTVALSASGTLAIVRFLLDSGLHKMVDRRETVAIATRSGVRDTLVGLAGISVDLGRWEFEGLLDGQPGMQLRLGRKHTVSFDETIKFTDSDQGNLLTTIPGLESVQVSDGVGQVTAKTKDPAGNPVASGTAIVAAALTARNFVASDARYARGVNHWKVQTEHGSFAVRMFPTEEGEHVSLSGSANVLDSDDVESL